MQGAKNLLITCRKISFRNMVLTVDLNYKLIKKGGMAEWKAAVMQYRNIYPVQLRMPPPFF